MAGCTALGGLAARGVLTPRHAKQVLFAKDRSTVVLRVAGMDGGIGDDVLVVRLLAGEISSLGAGAVDMSWIGQGSGVLVSNTAGDLVAFPLDGAASMTLARATCDHLTSPDGSRVLSFEDCNGSPATLTSIDTRTGSRTKLGRTALNTSGLRPNVVFSPGGRWAAFREPEPALDGSVATGGLIHIVDDKDSSYALSSAPAACCPFFASDDVLLFSTIAGGPVPADVYAHDLGSGDTSRVIAKGVDFESYFGYRVSPGGQWMLAAIIPADDFSPYALAAFGVADGREVALVGNLFPFWSTEVAWYSFAFAADNRHVLYLTADRPMHTALVASLGGAPADLSAEPSFAIPPTGNLVALTETRSTPMRVRLTDLDTTQDVASAEATSTPTQVTFTPDGRSLVYIESASDSAPARLRHLSGHTGSLTELARWTSNQLALEYACCNEPSPYPIDPTGCFAMVDSDLDGGTRLVLLPESGEPLAP